MDIGADDAPVFRHGSLGRSTGEAGERPRAVGAFADADVHLVACERGAVARLTMHGLEPLVPAQHGLDLEQAEAFRGADRSFDACGIADRSSEHLIAAAEA